MSAAFACGGDDSSALVGDAVVADHRRREADELLRVARIGDRLLVAGHPGREDGLAEGDAVGGDRAAAEDRAVLEQEVARLVTHAGRTTRPSATVFTTRRASVSPRSHEFAGSERKPSSVTVHSASRSRATRIRRAPTSIRGSSRPNAARGRRTCARAASRGRRRPGHDEVRVERRERRLEAGDAERRLLERDVLLVARVRRVVGRDARDRAAPERVAQRLAVVGRPQRRVHLRVRVERAHGLVGEDEMVRRDLARRVRRRSRARASSAATDSRAERCMRWIGRPSRRRARGRARP